MGDENLNANDVSEEIDELLEGYTPPPDNLGGEEDDLTYDPAKDPTLDYKEDESKPDDDPNPIQDPEPKPDPDPPVDEPKPDDTPVPDDGDGTPTTEDENKYLKEQNTLLLSRIEKLEEKISSTPQPAPAPDPKPDDGPGKQEPKSNVKDINFVGDLSKEEYDEIFENPDKFNAILQKVFNAGLEHSNTASVTENVLKNIPKLVVDYQQRNSAMIKIIDKFYSDNKDLVNVKKTVAAITNEVAAEMPDKPIAEVLDEAAVRTRKILGMKAKVIKSDPVPPAGDPKLKNGKVGQKKETPGNKDKLTGLAKEINDLITD